MYRVFTYFPINKIEFNDKLYEACNILVSIEDKRYFEREAYSFFSVKYIISLIKGKLEMLYIKVQKIMLEIQLDHV